MTKKRLLKCIGLLLPFLWISCADNDPSQKAEQIQQPVVVEAINYMKDKGLSALDMNKTFRKSTLILITRGNDKSEEFVPDWSTLQTYCDEYNDVRMFLLKSKSPVSGFVHTRINGKVTEQIAAATSKLVLWKIGGNLVGRIFTYIPDKKFLLESKNSITTLGYQLEGSDFSGICLVSTLDGIFVYGDKYDEGQHLFHFMPNLNHANGGNHNHFDEQPQSDLLNYHVFFELLTEKNSIETRTAYSMKESSGIKCSVCGKLVDSCGDHVIIKPDGLTCPLCGAPWHNLMCAQGGGTTGGGGTTPDGGTTPGGGTSPGGTPGGGGTTGGGTTSGGGTTGGEDQSDTSVSENKKTASEIKKTAANAVNKVLLDHKNDIITARCNEGVRNAFKELYNSKDLHNMSANDMIKYLKNNSNKWESVKMSEVQGFANEGYFVIAAWINPNGSGHVALIVPGIEKIGGWDGRVDAKLPNTMDTGFNMKVPSQPINKSFGKDKHSGVIFFKYK